MIRRFRSFLGEERLQLLIILLIVTGLGSTILVFIDAPWAAGGQTFLAFAFIAGALLIIGSRFDSESRGRWLAILIPAIGLVILGLMFPDLRLLFFGGALGWTLAGMFLFGRTRAPMEYRKSIKLMRKGDYKGAVEIMTELIKAEPDQPNHLRFRAELLRLWGKLGRARNDYLAMIEIDPKSAVAHNGLAEVELQAGNYAQARDAALEAMELAPGDWVATYNLGMIEDRVGNASAVVSALEQSLRSGVSDSRHRLLIRLYLARARMQLEQRPAAEHELKLMKGEREGLKEWQQILASEDAEVLRKVLGADVKLAAALMDGSKHLDALIREDSR